MGADLGKHREPPSLVPLACQSLVTKSLLTSTRSSVVARSRRQWGSVRSLAVVAIRRATSIRTRTGGTPAPQTFASKRGSDSGWLRNGPNSMRGPPLMTRQATAAERVVARLPAVNAKPQAPTRAGYETAWRLRIEPTVRLDVQAHLGHQSVETTMRWYARVRPGRCGADDWPEVSPSPSSCLPVGKRKP